MKNIIKKISLCGCIALGMGMVSCEDMMTVDTGDKAYVNANDTLYSYLGIMRAMQDVAERQVILGEIRGDLVSSSEYATDTLYAISEFNNPKDQSCSMLYASDYYNLINNCNFYIHNCDTNTIRANVKYMIPEYTQVKAIRAWAYLQLVKNYKEVPYITEPIKNLDVIKNFDYQNNLVNKDNLPNKLIEDGLDLMVDTEYPHYGSNTQVWGNWNNGAVDISARICFIPIRLVLGDAFLLRGNGTDYDKAADYYYSFLKKETTPMAQKYICLVEDEKEADVYDVTSTAIGSSANLFGYQASTYSYSESNEIITSIPSSANAGLGKMLTRVADIFGYNPSSSQTTDAEIKTDDEGNESTEYSANGAISVSPTYKRQYYPSFAYENVNLSQSYVQYTKISEDKYTVKYFDQQDARYYRSIVNLLYESNSYKLCAKVSGTSSFYYTIPIYRKNLVWLRLAEALNRSGYPEFAFAILKDGINQYTLPGIGEVTKDIIEEIDGVKYNTYTNEEGHTIYREVNSKDAKLYVMEEGVLTEFITNGAGYVKNTYKQREIVYNNIESMYYVNDSTELKNFLKKYSFTDDIWDVTFGIHAIGTGFEYKEGRTLNSWYGDYISTNISGVRDTVVYDYKKLIGKHLEKKTGTLTKADTINAVENIIVDELALETAFEGNRFYDLVRIAEHKNESGFNGTEWIANKIANRNSKQATKNSPAISNKDASLYAKLKDQKNWYFELPAWK